VRDGAEDAACKPIELQICQFTTTLTMDCFRSASPFHPTLLTLPFLTRPHSRMPLSRTVCVAVAWALFACSGTSGGGFTSNGPNGLCQPLSSEFDFAKKPPKPASDLAFCKEYRANTCCDKTSTLNVLRQLGPLFSPDSDIAASFSDRCRQISSTIACAPCHPEVGTRKRQGICPQMCSDWYYACSQGLYTEVDGILRPCVDSSLICAPLHAIVKTPAEFCERTGAGVGQTAHKHVTEEVLDLIKRDEQENARLAAPAAEDEDATGDDSNEATCFDGTIPSGARAAGATSTTPTAEDAGAARKRYYKTAEEVAEIEKQRQKRRDQQTDREFEQNPMVKIARAVQSGMQVILNPFQRWYGRMIRKLPLPRSVTTWLTDPLALSVVLFMVMTVVWGVLQRILSRLCRRCCRSGPQRARLATDSLLSSDGLAPEDIRALRVQALMQKAYADGAKESGSSDVNTFMAHPPVHPKSGTYTAIIDGEVVNIPQ
jgi:hypothetical protein